MQYFCHLELNCLKYPVDYLYICFLKYIRMSYLVVQWVTTHLRCSRFDTSLGPLLHVTSPSLLCCRVTI